MEQKYPIPNWISLTYRQDDGLHLHRVLEIRCILSQNARMDTVIIQKSILTNSFY